MWRVVLLFLISIAIFSLTADGQDFTANDLISTGHAQQRKTILWNDGEGKKSRDNPMFLKKNGRKDLIAFLLSL